MSEQRNPKIPNVGSTGDKGLEFQAENVKLAVSSQVMLALIAILSAIVTALGLRN